MSSVYRNNFYIIFIYNLNRDYLPNIYYFLRISDLSYTYSILCLIATSSQSSTRWLLWADPKLQTPNSATALPQWPLSCSRPSSTNSRIQLKPKDLARLQEYPKDSIPMRPVRQRKKKVAYIPLRKSKGREVGTGEEDGRQGIADSRYGRTQNTSWRTSLSIGHQLKNRYDHWGSP